MRSGGDGPGELERCPLSEAEWVAIEAECDAANALGGLVAVDEVRRRRRALAVYARRDAWAGLRMGEGQAPAWYAFSVRAGHPADVAERALLGREGGDGAP